MFFCFASLVITDVWPQANWAMITNNLTGIIEVWQIYVVSRGFPGPICHVILIKVMFYLCFTIILIQWLIVNSTASPTQFMLTVHDHYSCSLPSLVTLTAMLTEITIMFCINSLFICNHYIYSHLLCTHYNRLTTNFIIITNLHIDFQYILKETNSLIYSTYHKA